MLDFLFIPVGVLFGGWVAYNFIQIFLSMFDKPVDYKAQAIAERVTVRKAK